MIETVDFYLQNAYKNPKPITHIAVASIITENVHSYTFIKFFDLHRPLKNKINEFINLK